MTVTDVTLRDQTGALSFEIDLPHPPERVWRALTDPDLLASWLLPVSGFRPEPGVVFTLQAPPQPGWDGVVQCAVVEAEAQRRIRYTWVVGDLDTVVTFTLTPTESGTLLRLTHAGFQPQQRHNFGGARYGWRMFCDRLVGVLAPPSSQP
jgi:uncharacterized protein YndB with AHSA1/START domain